MLGELGENFCVPKKPTFRCSCGIDRVWRTLALLPEFEIKELGKSNLFCSAIFGVVVVCACVCWRFVCVLRCVHCVLLFGS